MPYVEDGDLLQTLADALHQESGQLSAEWATIAAAARLAAIADIESIVLGRGYTASQLASWDHALAYSLDQALYRCLTRGIQPGVAVSVEFVKLLDRREDLKTLTLSIAGTPVKPGSPSVGAGGGRISEDGYRLRSDDPL